jgi:hypothetical protein
MTKINQEYIDCLKLLLDYFESIHRLTKLENYIIINIGNKFYLKHV